MGDIIKEVNGQPVGSDPARCRSSCAALSGSVILKILLQLPGAPSAPPGGPLHQALPPAQDPGGG